MRFGVHAVVAGCGFLHWSMGVAQIPEPAQPQVLADDATRTDLQPSDASIASASAQGPASQLAVIPVTQQPSATENTGGTPVTRTNRVMEEIIVTAQKREEQLQDVPISISAFSSEKLDALGVQNARDLGQVTPGLVYATNFSNYAVVYIRGIGADAFIPSVDSSVATYVDGVYFPFNHGLASSFTEVERIEVLKGPQGTLFGRNATGGAINIVTKTPDQSFNMKLSQLLGSFDSTTTKAYVTGPLGGGFSGNLSLLYDQGNTHIKPAPDSPVQKDPEKKDKGLNFKLRWEDESGQVSADLAGYLTKSSTSLNSTAQDVTPLGVLLGIRTGDPYEYKSNLEGALDTENRVAYTTVKWETDPVDIKLLGSYEEVESETLFDFDGSSPNAVEAYVPAEFVRAVTGELQLLSKQGGAFTFDDTIEWTAGYYYYKSKGGYPNIYFSVLNPANPVSTSPLSLSGLLGSILEIPIGLGVPLANHVELELNGLVRTEAHALYAQTTWRPLDWFGLTLGGRYQDETRGTVVAKSGVSRRPSPPLPLFDFPLEETQKKSFSPKVSLEFRPFGDGTMIYTSWQKGIKSGTYNVAAIYTPPAYVEPEEVTAVELGVKGDLIDRTLTYSAAAFQNKVENLQTQVLSLASGGLANLVNVPRATIKGAEAELTWQAFPELLPGFVATANGTYLDGRYKEFPDGFGYSQLDGVYFGPGQLVPSPPQDFSGNTTVRTPKWSGTGGLSHASQLSNGTLEVGVTGTFNSGFFYDAQNVTTQPEYWLLGARVSYLYDPWNVRITALGQNLTGETYYYDKLPTDFNTGAVYAPRQTYALTIAWEFMQ